MQFTTTPRQPPLIREVLPCNIVVGEKVMGELDPHMNGDGSIRWHAVIRLDDTKYAGTLLQGFGPTHEAAIADAIQCGRDDARRTEEFARAIGYDERTNP